MRLIDAEELYDKAEEKYKNASGFYRPIYRGFVDDVANAPTVDAVPVVHGAWIESLNCTYMLPQYSCGVCGGGHLAKTWKFCPNCGAKMDGGANT